MTGINITLSSWIPKWNQEGSTMCGKLQSAIDLDSMNEIKTLLHNSTLINQPLPNGEIPLNYAIRQGRHEIVTLIVSKFTTILDTVDAHGLTPVDHAFLSGDSRMIGIILGYKLGSTCGFQYDEEAKNFSNAFNNTGSKKEISFARTVSEYCELKTESLYGAFQAAAEGDLPCVSAHLETIPDVNTTTFDGWSLLHLAAKSGNADLVKLLVDKGARTDLITHAQKISPLHVAALGNNRQVILNLLEAGADLNATDKQGSTALHYAMTKNELFSAQLLIERGMDYSKVNQLGMSPLSIMAAIIRNQTNSKDELKLDHMQAMMFAGIAASCIAGYCQADLAFVLNTLAWVTSTLPFFIGVNEISKSIFKNPSKSQSKCAYFAVLSLLTQFKALQIPFTAWTTYKVGQNTIKEVAKAWEYRHIETARPIRNAVIYGINSLYTGKELINAINGSKNIVNNTMSVVERLLGFSVSEYFTDAKPRYTAHVKGCSEQSVNPIQCTRDFVSQEFFKFRREAIFTPAELCEETPLQKCIEKYKLVPEDPRDALSILGVSADASCEAISEVAKNLQVTHHPDKKGHGLTSRSINVARTTLCPTRYQTDNALVSYTKQMTGENL